MPPHASHNSGRKQNYRFGLWAEFLCRCRLRLLGYQIRAVRLRTAAGEIDIVASRGAVLAIIEVKARQSFSSAIASLSHQQRQRIMRATAIMLARQPAINHYIVRFDVMLVIPWRWPQHIHNAWQAGE
jgi:putative endonuclease